MTIKSDPDSGAGANEKSGESSHPRHVAHSNDHIRPNAAGALSATLSPRLNTLKSPIKVRPIGGKTTVVLGEEVVTYETGVKEAQMRLSADPLVRQASNSSLPAGVRKEVRELAGPRRLGPVGGKVNVQLNDGSNLAYTESIDEAQRRAALDPAARAEVMEQVPAGGRVDRPQGLGCKGRPASKISLDWDVPQAQHSAASVRQPDSPRILHPEQAVGGRSAVYLRDASMGSVLGGDGRQAVAITSARRATANVSSVGHLLTRPADVAVPPPVLPPRSPLKRVQPLGGRGLLGLGLEGGLERVGAVHVHPRSVANNESHFTLG